MTRSPNLLILCALCDTVSNATNYFPVVSFLFKFVQNRLHLEVTHFTSSFGRCLYIRSVVKCDFKSTLNFNFYNRTRNLPTSGSLSRDDHGKWFVYAHNRICQCTTYTYKVFLPSSYRGNHCVHKCFAMRHWKQEGKLQEDVTIEDLPLWKTWWID